MTLIALSQVLSSADKKTFRIVPAGKFKRRDGSEPTSGYWQLTERAGRAIAAASAQRSSDTVIDYEHASLTASSTGVPAPAAGWYKALEWRPDGLYVTDARWTAQALGMINGGEYRYISPVIQFDGEGMITGVFNIALTNNPALDGLTDLAALTAKISVQSMPLQARIETGFSSSCGMTENQKSNFVAVFGHTPAELRQLNPQAAHSARLEEGTAGLSMTEQQHSYFTEVFGHTPGELRKLCP